MPENRCRAPTQGSACANLSLPAASPPAAPGQPTLQQLSGMYGLKRQRRDTAVMGIVGNPVSHRWAAGCAYLRWRQDGRSLVSEQQRQRDHAGLHAGTRCMTGSTVTV